MPLKKRSYATRAKIAKRKGRTGYANIIRKRGKRSGGLTKRVNHLYRMIETKEMTRKVVNQTIAHNNITVLNINPFLSNNAADEPMGAGAGSRIGDAIAVRGMLIKGFAEAALSRTKVYFRVMLVKSAKGDIPTRNNLFKNNSDNKMIDQINTEHHTIVAQKIFTVAPSNAGPTALQSLVTGVANTATVGGLSNKMFSMWIPGVKFNRSGIVTYENLSASQVKFFDYRVVVLAYDWYGTPQDVNNVGVINELYTKIYFKDA